MARWTHSSGFSIAQNTCGSQFLMSTKVAVSCFVLWFPHRHIFSFSGRFLFWEVKIVTLCKVGRIWRLLRVWDFVFGQEILHKLRRVRWCVVVVDLPVTWRQTTFLVACGVLRRWDAAEIVNNIPCLIFDPLQRTGDAQHRLELRKLRAPLLSCFEIRVAFHRRSPFF